MLSAAEHRAALAHSITRLGEAAVAVSGGVDSLTLAALTHRTLGRRSLMLHAVSPAVPGRATERVRELGRTHGWRLELIDAGEFADPDYRRNPANRCFFCKSDLYGAIRRRTSRPILSGTNLDDLGEWRPGLEAARAHGVRHPYVEAGIGKAAVRGLARHLGLGEIAELPASPCLSSRVETGIPIRPATLALIDAAERLVAELAAPATVRCRVRQAGLVIELDRASLEALEAAGEARLKAALGQLLDEAGIAAPVGLAAYRAGSAFLVPRP